MTYMYVYYVYAYCIWFYLRHVSENSTENKKKKAIKEIEEEEGEDLMGIEAGDTINIFFFCLVFVYSI